MVEVKICGLTDIGGLDAALDGGARHVGLVFFPKSPRHLSLERAAALADRARGRAAIVAVTVNASADDLAALAARVAPDFIQFHGGESPARVAAMRPHARQGAIVALPIAGASDFAACEGYAPVADLFLFDAKPPPGAALPGGNGAAFDWTLLAGRAFPRPWILSGGLHPGNVGAAIAASGARAVDVSSGVETAPGVKDQGKIRDFLTAAGADSPSART